MKKIVFLSISFLFLTSALLFAELPYERAGKDRHQYFATEPRVLGFTGSKVDIVFETTHPTPAASVSYGIILPDGKTTTELYRTTRGERLKGCKLTKKHRITIDISYLEQPRYGDDFEKNHGGIVVYKVSGFDPKAGFVQYYKGKLAYRRSGKVRRGKYSLIPAIIEGPFIDCVTHNSAVISWRTDRKCRGYVEIKEKYGRKYRKIYGRYGRENEIKITSLKPSRYYTYRVYPSSRTFPSYSYTFKTAPKPGSRKPFKFVFLSDGRNGTGSGEQNWNGVNVKSISKLLNLSERENPSLIIFGGDLINGYSSDTFHTKSQFRTFKKVTQRVGSWIPIYEAIGNHEVSGDYYKLPDPELKGRKFLAFKDKSEKSGKNMEKIFSDLFVNPRGSVYGIGEPKRERRDDIKYKSLSRGPNYGETVYSFNYDNIHFVVLNSNYWTTAVSGARWSSRRFADKEGTFWALYLLSGNREGYIMKEQRKWLKRDLDRAQKDKNIDWIIAIFHEPIFPNGGHLGDCMYWGKWGHGELGGLNERDKPLGDVGDMRNEMVNIFMEHPKTLAVLTGDEHNYSRMIVDNRIEKEYSGKFWQIISGGAGAPFYMEDKSTKWNRSVEAFLPYNHFCLFEVNGKKIALKVISSTGRMVDFVKNMADIKR